MAQTARAARPESRRPWDSVKGRMALALALALLIPAAYSVYGAARAARERDRQIVEVLDQAAELVSAYESRFLDTTKELLDALAMDPAIVLARQPECAVLLNELLQRNVDYRFAGVVDAAGAGVCGAPVASAFRGRTFGDRAWFHVVRDTMAFTVSGVLRSRVDDRAAIVAAAPLRGHDKRFVGVVALSFEPDLLADVRHRIAMQRDGVLFLTDQGGRVLPAADGTEADALSGAPMPDARRQAIASAANAFRAIGTDGIERIYVEAPVGGGPLQVLLGLPAVDRMAWVDRDVLVGVLGPSLIFVLALLVTWFAAETLVARHVVRLARSVRRYADGKDDRLPMLRDAPIEVRELAARFAGLVDQVRTRERELTLAVEQRDLMLREIHHRVKNNLQIVTSLLSLRARSLASPALRAAMAETQTRIKALALVHLRLYEHDLATVELRPFLLDLCDLLQESLAPPDGRIELETTVADMRISTEQITPLALLLTEAMTNAYRYAFPDGRAGSVTVRLTSEAGQATLEVADDGVGRSAAESAGAADGAVGAGLTLMAMLAEQMAGTLVIEDAGGTLVRLTFQLALDEQIADAAEPTSETDVLRDNVMGFGRAS